MQLEQCAGSLSDHTERIGHTRIGRSTIFTFRAAVAGSRAGAAPAVRTKLSVNSRCAIFGSLSCLNVLPEEGVRLLGLRLTSTGTCLQAIPSQTSFRHKYSTGADSYSIMSIIFTSIADKSVAREHG